MAEVREFIEKFRGGDRGMEELIAAITLMQGGTFDMNSFLAGMAFSKGGRGLDRSMLMMMVLNSANANSQQTTTGATVNPMQALLPMFMMMGRDDWDGPEKTVEFVEKKTGAGGR
jgi:hypothetical protein